MVIIYDATECDFLLFLTFPKTFLHIRDFIEILRGCGSLQRVGQGFFRGKSFGRKAVMPPLGILRIFSKNFYRSQNGAHYKDFSNSVIWDTFKIAKTFQFSEYVSDKLIYLFYLLIFAQNLGAKIFHETQSKT